MEKCPCRRCGSVPYAWLTNVASTLIFCLFACDLISHLLFILTPINLRRLNGSKGLVFYIGSSTLLCGTFASTLFTLRTFLHPTSRLPSFTIILVVKVSGRLPFELLSRMEVSHNKRLFRPGSAMSLVPSP
ncbi:hypothetical protein BDV40DRAFT_175656 [Aspergillus tamarii]|uniref:Uncharacterized protein n=1 Tax=Aspergillus tamarii TaxID=41984 RepID=A0A5N6UT21_ASPTM|nr:hypothetical protein BDV40DRAFT_175656 [Aspergillus tamarii]